MPPVEFEPIIPASEWLQTHALDHAVTGIGSVYTYTIHSISPKVHFYLGS